MTRRVRVEIDGIVQGVGFRPFVYALAHRHGLVGHVRNESGGVVVEAQGDTDAVAALIRKIRDDHPPLAVIHDMRVEEREPAADENGFVIADSSSGSAPVNIAPDSDVCPDCLRELFDPSDRRHRYPFITCTNCGPRYSIVRDVPYDRPLTTMAAFPLCPDCAREYQDPADRRFHAQPVACPACGPHVVMDGAADDPVRDGARVLADGGVLAVKGLGGFHLAVDATNGEAVRELRRRKHRPDKPFALMARDIDVIRRSCFVSDVEERLLAGPERPVVLLRRRADAPVAPEVAPGNRYFGFMLPSTPLHHLLLECFDTPVVMTSGNRSDEPMAYRNDEALERLHGIADRFLFHDREIHVRVDDSVLRVFGDNPLFLRRSRGFVPRPITLPFEVPPVAAFGGELKSCACVASGTRAVMTHHIGDLSNPETVGALSDGVNHLASILRIAPALAACDLHPDYASTDVANRLDVPVVPVQHHHAHMASCMAENRLTGDVIGVIFDGTGLGLDGTVWGGEFLAGGYGGFERLGHLRPVRLPGGDAAAREPFRMALSWLYDAIGDRVFDLALPCLDEIGTQERPLFSAMLARGVNSPFTSSCGRLFDAVAAILDLRRRMTYEGQAAIELEGLAEDFSGELELLPYAVERDDIVLLDPRPTLLALIEAARAGRPGAALAMAFHRTLARAAADVCDVIRGRSGLERVVLSGGVFQNRLMYEETHRALLSQGFDVFVHRLVSPNDSGIALGQAAVAGWSSRI